MPHNRDACHRCGIPLPAPGLSLCGPCSRKPPTTDSTLALFRYEEPIRTLIHELKFGNRYACARLFALLLADAVLKTQSLPEVLIPVPLHWDRYKQRGYNQSLEIARSLAGALRSPLAHDHCARIR